MNLTQHCSGLDDLKTAHLPHSSRRVSSRTNVSFSNINADLLVTKKLTKSDPAHIIIIVSVASVENILKESRSAIIDLLKINGAMSVEQLAGELEVSKVCVRRHLSLLESDGLIIYEEERRDRGRPRYLYKLTEKARCFFPQNYGEFAKEILVQLQRQFGDEALQQVLSARADELIAQLQGDLEGKNFDERVKSLVKIVSAKGYLADARKLKDGSFRLRQRNCPTENVAIAYPHVCDEEVRVYREALGCEVVRECRIADGARVCEFRVAQPTLTQISKRIKLKEKEEIAKHTK